MIFKVFFNRFCCLDILLAWVQELIRGDEKKGPGHEIQARGLFHGMSDYLPD